MEYLCLWSGCCFLFVAETVNSVQWGPYYISCAHTPRELGSTVFIWGSTSSIMATGSYIFVYVASLFCSHYSESNMSRQPHDLAGPPNCCCQWIINDKDNGNFRCDGICKTHSGEPINRALEGLGAARINSVLNNAWKAPFSPRALCKSWRETDSKNLFTNENICWKSKIFLNAARLTPLLWNLILGFVLLLPLGLRAGLQQQSASAIHVSCFNKKIFQYF